MSNFIPTPKDLSKIRKLAKQLPEIPLKGVEILTGVQVLANKEAYDFDTSHIEPLKKYKVFTGKGTRSKVSQKSMLEAEFKKGGWQAITKYVAQFGFQPKKSNQ
jgi:hypothetical protein